jgi:basic membrane protein A
VALALVGRIDDGAYGQAAYQGLTRVGYALGVETLHRDRIAPDPEAILAALQELARGPASLIVVAGEGTSEAAQRAAWEFPKKKFALLDGTLTRPNLAVYRLLPEQSAWLAGAAAALASKSGTVAHVGGERTARAERLRAAFADGARNAVPKIKFLTAFAGTDTEAARRVLALALADGADVVFAPLPAQPLATIAGDANAAGAKVIGAIFDWVELDPQRFAGSAVADPGTLVLAAARDVRDNVFVGDIVRDFGVRRPDAVRLALSPDLPQPLRERLETLSLQVGSGRIAIPERYDGPELRVV